MGAFVQAAFIVFLMILYIAQTVGCSYFASVVNSEIRPYFDEHGMQAQAKDSRQAFGYLVASAVLSGLSVIVAPCRLFRSPKPNGEDKSGLCISACTTYITFAAVVTVFVFACLTAAHSWAWWKDFASEGLDHLASQCQRLAIYLIVVLVSSAVGSIVGIIRNNWRHCKPTHQLGQE
ncbi:hypothetical protein F4821DRAFT_264385 [Hypoxylon rubiginosum]|uniref:Uncharacterized protein n=1 Tax=Hypoxylon rubiginosum TaxID=110542 RepID=A0ACC0CNL6_9PEZI|nr:hypothetical protein F4821DRAFT_264385 [Hypoxylon rubiginosum]